MTLIPVRRFQPLPDMDFTKAFARGRYDVPFFSHYFCNRMLHDGQCEYVMNADASINVLATSNRYGKTSVLNVRHVHPCIYKAGAEPEYMVDGVLDEALFKSTEFKTVHSAGLWDTAKIVWHDVLKTIRLSPRLRPFIAATPKTLPPDITFENGSQILFRTLGDNGEGIDGHSFYHISIDEAGWIKNLRRIMDNVAAIRTADVDGTIDICGTFKPGISIDFYYYARRASIDTGRNITFDHRATRDYYKEFGLEEMLADVKRERAEQFVG